MITCCIFNFSFILEDAGSAVQPITINLLIHSQSFHDTPALPGSGLGSIFPLPSGGQQTSSSFFLLLPGTNTVLQGSHILNGTVLFKSL